LERIYGEGFADKLRAALLALNPQEHGEILDLFNTRRFIESNNANYGEIEAVARNLGIVR
jgi:phosphonate transport system substrate-binding protein